MSNTVHVRRVASLIAIAGLAFVATVHAQGRGRGGAVAARDTLAALLTDPRVGLRPGMDDAGVAAKNMELIGHRPKPDIFESNQGLTYANSDMAFRGNFLYQGNFSGFSIWDISNPREPVLRKAFACATGQGDPSIYGNLLFISSESGGNRLDCGTQRITDPAKEKMVGVRIFDVSDPDHPKQVADVQTCRGSHTHTLVPDPKDKGIVYIYVSGSAGIRQENDMPGCFNYPIDSANTAGFRIDVIRVPLAHPEQAKIVNGARIFADLTRAVGHGNPPGDTLGRGGRGGGRGAGAGGRVAGIVTFTEGNGRVIMVPGAMAAPVLDSIAKAHGRTGAPIAADSLAAATMLASRPGVVEAAPGGAFPAAGRGGAAAGGAGRGNGGPSQCHDITVYPAIGLAGGACGGYGLLLDISDPANPRRIDFAGDSNFSFWHSATFSNDGSKILFSDEWGGGQQPKCRAIDPLNWGGDALFSIVNRKLVQGAYFKMPAAQTSEENCVAHNGSLVPVPGRDIMVQGWYQGGVDVFDWTDIHHPHEIAYFDRGPIPNQPWVKDSISTAMLTGGYWAGYWYNGHIVASEIIRGIDIFDLTPSEWLSQNEIDAAKLVHMDQFNPQSQPKIVWPAAFPVVRSYLDQLVRNDGLAAAQTAAIAKDLNAAEKMTAGRAGALEKIAAQLDKDVAGAADGAKVKMMAAAVRDLAKVSK
jgi:hypothetical protein